MWDSYQVIRTTFPSSPCPELCTMISVHLQLHFTFAFYRPTWAPAFWMVLVLRSPPLLAQMAFLSCSIYFMCKKWEDLILERCQGRFPHFPSSVQWEPCASLSPINEIATVERTIQNSSPMAKNEALGKICWYIKLKEPYGPPCGGDYHGARKTCLSTWLCTTARAQYRAEVPAGLRFKALCSSAPGCVGKRGLLGHRRGGIPLRHAEHLDGKENTPPCPHAPSGWRVLGWNHEPKLLAPCTHDLSPGIFSPLFVLTGLLFQAQMTTAVQESALAASLCWRWAHGC